MLAALSLPGCTSWHPGRLGDGPVPPSLRATLRDSSAPQIEGARIVTDSLLVGRGIHSDILSILTRDLVAIQTRRFDLPKTLTLVGVSVGIGVPALLGLFWIVVILWPGP
jgi:hypothetical protein